MRAHLGGTGMICHLCGGPERISVVTLEHNRWMALSHCRAEPHHDVGEPYLSEILSLREHCSPSEWLADDPSPTGAH